MLPHLKQAHGCWRRTQAALRLPSGSHYLSRAPLPPVPCAEQTVQPEASCSSPRGGSGGQAAGRGGGKGRGQTFGFYKVKEIYFLRS